VVAGDLVYLRAGTYAPFTLSGRSGTEARPIVFAGYPGDASRPVIDGAEVATWVVNLNNVHDVVVRNLEVIRGRAPGQNGGGILVNGSYRVTVEDNVLHDNSAYGVRSVQSTYIAIRDNDIYGNAAGIEIRYQGEGTQVLDNLVHDQDRMMTNTVGGNDDTGAQAIIFVRSTGTVLAKGNRMWQNRAQSYDYGHDGGAFEIYSASNVTMTDNVMWDNDTTFESGTDSGVECANNVFARNIAYDDNPNTLSLGMILRCARDMVIAHNTFQNLDYWVFDINTNSTSYSGKIDGVRILNNVTSMNNGKIYAFGAGIPLATMTIDHNLDYNPGRYIASVSGYGNATTTAQLTSWTGKQANGVNAAPGFVDGGAFDFRLMANSPALDRGTVVPAWSAGYAGAAPDMGRYER
jgi:parallel beta-helix repeat protein